ncbi:MAG: methionyl-tRNA synthetase [Actinomycetota bacterium]|nr:methionyl-tRNA synthetase [Actinomycetota bacterium]
MRSRQPSPEPTYAGQDLSFYVTTPIFYGNGDPHLGHAYSTMAADILARHMRQRGEDVFFLTGTDEHGEPIAQAAEKQGVSPQELVDKSAASFRDMVVRVDATNDFFIRTTDQGHIERVQAVVNKVKENGYVYEGTYEGWYCPRCADFKNENEIGPGDTCLIHEIPLDREQENNWFFKLSAFQEDLERMYEENPGMIRPDFRRNEALAFIRQGLNDVSLSRSQLSWGVPLAWDPEQVMYVWFDALLNYYTALGYANEGEDLTDRYWPASWHIIAKDILKFHTVYWPAFLMAAGIEVPQRIFIHGYLLMGDKKMSKSLGNVLDPFEVIEKFGADALRFYCFREVSFGQDGSISTEGFEGRYESELANDFGNLASRSLAMISRYRDGIQPQAEPDPLLAADFDGITDRVRALFDEAQIGQALEEIWVLVRRLNRYVEESQPWVLAKDEADAERLDQVLYSLAEGLRVLTLLLHPYLPNSTDILLAALGQADLELAAYGSRPGGTQTEKIKPLFPKL